VVNYKKAFDTCDKATAYKLNSVLDRLDEFDYDATAIDDTIETVSGSNLSATHKITRSATLVVAASDSSEKSKAQADYVCDGVADNEEIQAAVNALASCGGKIILLEGNYRGGNISITTQNIQISGVRGAKYTYTAADSNAAFTISSENVHIDTLHIDCATLAGHSIYFNGAANCSVRHCICENAINDNILVFNASHDIQICNNVTRYTAATGPYCGIEVTKDCYDVLISENIVYENASGIRAHCHTGETLERITIVNNILHGNKEYGIYISGSLGTFKNAIISNNMLNEPDATQYAVYVAKVIGVTCTGNHVTDAGLAGMFFHDGTTHGTIANNVISNSTSYGISVNISSDLCLDSNIINSPGSHGCMIDTSNNISVRGGVVALGQKHGIYLKASDYCRVSGVTLKNNGQAGGTYNDINIASTSTYNTISDNYISADLTTKTQYGVIEIAPTDDYNKIINNTISGNSVASVHKSGANTIVAGNRGYVTENKGTATITIGQTSVNVVHGMAKAPTRVQLTPTTATAGKQYYVSAKAATTFTITIDSETDDDITDDVSFDWQAVI